MQTHAGVGLGFVMGVVELLHLSMEPCGCPLFLRYLLDHVGIGLGIVQGIVELLSLSMEPRRLPATTDVKYFLDRFSDICWIVQNVFKSLRGAPRVLESHHGDLTPWPP